MKPKLTARRYPTDYLIGRYFRGPLLCAEQERGLSENADVESNEDQQSAAGQRTKV